MVLHVQLKVANLLKQLQTVLAKDTFVDLEGDSVQYSMRRNFMSTNERC